MFFYATRRGVGHFGIPLPDHFCALDHFLGAGRRDCRGFTRSDMRSASGDRTKKTSCAIRSTGCSVFLISSRSAHGKAPPSITELMLCARMLISSLRSRPRAKATSRWPATDRSTFETEATLTGAPHVGQLEEPVSNRHWSFRAPDLHEQLPGRRRGRLGRVAMIAVHGCASRLTGALSRLPVHYSQSCIAGR